MVILEELKNQLGVSRNAVVRALLSYTLEHPEIINEVFPLEEKTSSDGKIPTTRTRKPEIRKSSNDC